MLHDLQDRCLLNTPTQEGLQSHAKKKENKNFSQEQSSAQGIIRSTQICMPEVVSFHLAGHTKLPTKPPKNYLKLKFEIFLEYPVIQSGLQ